MANQNKLFDQFPPVSTKEWLDRIAIDLKGADFNKRLVWKTGEGFDVMPFYRREDLEKINYTSDFLSFLPRRNGSTDSRKPEVLKMTGAWLIRQDIKVTDYSEANRKALSILTKGIDSIGFIISDAGSINDKNFALLLRDINPECVELNFLSNGKAIEIIKSLAGVAGGGKYDVSKINGAVEADPLGRLMINGTLCIPVEDGFDYLASLTRETFHFPKYRNIQVNGSGFTNAGADAVTELGFSLSMAVDYIEKLSERGIEPDEAAKRIRFSFGTGSNYFIEIAKLRAARLLWSVIAGGYKTSKNELWRMEIHCTTSKYNSTVYEPYVNMLRTQTEAMSAILGGADSLTVNPFDTAFREPSEFSERIARNQQLLLKEEAYFDKVADPSSGSYYIENLTALIAENSWKLLLETEDSGGFISGLRSGMIRKRIAGIAARRKNDFARRREILVGTNQYPDPAEKIAPDSAPVFHEDSPVNSGQAETEPVKLFRVSEELEKIRMAAGNAAVNPSVFLLKIGDRVMRQARSQFTSGFFGCAGYTILDNEGFENIDDSVKAALDSKADIVVICSSDAEYPVFAPETFNRLNGRAIVVIAGNPECSDSLRLKGLENYIHLKSDLVEALSYYNSKIGLEQ